MDFKSLLTRFFFLIILLPLFGLCLNAQKPNLSEIRLPKEIRTINVLLPNGGDCLLLGTGQGLYEFKDGNFKRFFDESNPKDYQINCLAKSKDNCFWWGTYNGVLIKYCNERIVETFDLKTKSKDDNYLITSIAITDNELSEDNVLVTTSGGEIFSINKSTKLVEKTVGPEVNTIYTVQYGYSPMIWLCTSDGFYTRNKKSRWKRKTGLYTAYNLVENLGKYWAIGRDEQKRAVFMLYYSEKENAPTSKYKWKNFDLSQLNDRFLRFHDVAFTENEIAWIATSAGLIRYNPMTASVKLYSELNGVKINEIQHIVARSENSLWVGSSGKRLYKIELEK